MTIALYLKSTGWVFSFDEVYKYLHGLTASGPTRRD